MLLLLPPSLGKTAPAWGTPVDLAALSHPKLAAARTRVGDALVKVSGQRNALEVLSVSEALRPEVDGNLEIWSAPAAPAHLVYSGVLFEAADAGSWTPSDLARAAQRVRIMSGLWGALSPADAIPAYRLPMGTTLARLGPLAAFWRSHLTVPLEQLADGGLVVDCRSAPYAAAWRPAHARRVTVTVVRERAGVRSVVSHLAKHTRGLLTAELVRAADEPQTLDELAHVASRLVGGDVIAVETGAGRPGAGMLGTSDLTLVVSN